MKIKIPNALSPQSPNPSPQPPAPSTQPPEPKTPLTLRAVLLSLLLAVLFGCISPRIDFLLSNTYLGACHLPPGALGALLVLLAANAVLWLVSKRWRLSRAELLTLFITGLFSALVPGRGSESFFVPCLVVPFYFATPENRWLSFLQPNLKSWFTPALNADGSVNTQLVQTFFNGGDVPWQFWLMPLLAWTLLIGALYAMFACLSVILRAQWIENESLAFPLLRLPLMMTETPDTAKGETPFFRNSLMWVGFGIAVFIQGLNGLYLYFPEIPQVPLTLDSRQYFSEPPLNNVGPMVFRVLPIAVGISFLLSSEVALSFWFFYLLHKAEYIIAWQLGFPPNSLPEPVWTRGFSKAFISFQQIGAFWAYAAIVLWTGRAHLLHVGKRAFGMIPPEPREASEPFSYRAAFFGFIAASGVILMWTVAAGVHPLLALGMWLTYLVIVLCLTRVVVEGGFLYVNHGWSPLLPMANLFGTGGAAFAASSSVPAAIMQGAMMIDLKAMLLPSFLQGFKLAREAKIPLRPLFWLIAGCIAISFGVGVYTNLNLPHKYGALQMQQWYRQSGPSDAALNARALIGPPPQGLAINWFWMGIGSATTWLLCAARAQWSWFPLHPIGYLMWAPYVMFVMWFSIFIGWLAKALIMHFGGPDSYKKVVPGFLGLALGDVTMILLWNAVDAWQGKTGHQLMPG